jgi:hypothetical protein
MTIFFEERASDSRYVETIMRGWTASDGSTIRPADSHWHLVFVRHHGRLRSVYVGPWTTAGIASWQEGADILWIKFKLGTFMPHLPARDFLNVETILPDASSNSFWLNGSAWKFPDYENVEVFADRLVREEVLVFDPVINEVLHGHLPQMPPRTVRQHFLRAIGVSLSHIWQVERAQRAAALLEQGVAILDTVYQVGYFDQPHLTRSLKHFIGQTPKQRIEYPPSESIRLNEPE